MRPRPRDFGLPLGALPTGPLNAITDVDGVRVGHVTVTGGDAVRCGVTAVLPPSDDLLHRRVPAASVSFSWTGAMVGAWRVNELGLLDVPVLLTDTLSVGRVLDGATAWMLARYPRAGREEPVFVPVVGACDNTFLDDAHGGHVRPEHAREALAAARGGAVEEGSVGAGAGMTCHGFKGGIGTSSRVVEIDDAAFTVGVLVCCGHGRRDDLVIAGQPIGRLLGGRLPVARVGRPPVDGTFNLVVATDAPLQTRGLSHLAQHAWQGVARTGGRGSGGDSCLAFSTRNDDVLPPPLEAPAAEELDESQCEPLYDAVREATEEAVLGCLFAGTDTVGRDGNTVFALPLDLLAEMLRA